MSKCKYLIDISPYDPLCDHPCRLYGGGAVEAECETCQYHIEDLERENAKLRELCTDMWRFTGAACKKYPKLFDPAAQGPQMVQLNALDAFEQRMRELGVEV